MKRTTLLLLAGMLWFGAVTQSHAVLTEYFFSQESNGTPTDMSGATLAMGPNNDDVTAGSFPIGFSFNFDGTNYTTFTVSSNGWMKLGAHTTNSNLGNNLAGGEFPTIAGFWDDLRTNNTGGYIQYKLEGTPGSQVLTVEWNTSYWSAPTSGPWVWQVRLYESGIIEFLYVGMVPNFASSATIGINASASNFISVTPTTTIATTSSTVSNNGINLNVTPIADNTVYTFSRVLNDLACDSVWFNGANAVNGFARDMPVGVNARITNRGSIAKNNIPIRFDVYYNGVTRVYSSAVGSVSPGPRLGSDIYHFSNIPGTVNATAGIYTVAVYAEHPIDEDRKNDTCKVPYFILGDNDVLPFKILSPYPKIPPLFSQYPVNENVPIEVRFLNVGVHDQSSVPVGYRIISQATGAVVYEDNSLSIPGTFRSATFRDVNMPPWTPNAPGAYCIQVYTNMTNDEDRSNDTIPFGGSTFCFVANYEIELAAVNGGRTQQSGDYPVGRPIYMEGIFANNGLNDATNSAATMTVYDPAGRQVYQRSVSVLDIPADGGRAAQRFPDFTPPVSSGPGQYCVGLTIKNLSDPLASNDSTSFCFNVLSPLQGQIYVGYGEKYRTIQQARDAIVHLGVSGPVEFILIDDDYVVEPVKPEDFTLPALDFRGDIIGSGPTAPIVWRGSPGRDEITIHLQSPSGIGIWFGQQDTLNPNGYMTFDGGPEHKLRFVLENTSGVNDLAVPFMFGRGSSNYTVRNCVITSVNPRLCANTITLPSYNPNFGQFSFRNDDEQEVSAGILLRNTLPFDPVTLQNNVNADTVLNQNNLFEGNQISGFAYGILSVGAGHSFKVQTARFDEVTNRNNIYRNNEIENVGRAGIAVTYESNSQIVGNKIRGVHNNCGPRNIEKGSSVQASQGAHAAGIWVTAGGNASGNRGYSNNLEIAGNQVSDISTSNGVGAGIWVENNRNTLITPANVVQEFPSQSDMKVWNNMAWNYTGKDLTVGIGFGIAPEAGIDYQPRGNMVLNNTIYNSNGNTAEEYGIGVEYTQAVVKNNLIVAVNPNALGVGYRARATQKELSALSVESDYNLFWVPNGAVGGLERVSPQGFDLPSPPLGVSLQQWQYASGLDRNSLVGNVIPEFISTTAGAENLHLNPQLKQSLAGNRGTKLPLVTNDIDGDPRGQTAASGRYDIGSDEFWGTINNRDLIAEDVLGPFGYRAISGTFSDGEYVMTGPIVDLKARVRNLGGLPVAAAQVTMSVEYWTGSSWVSEMTITRQPGVDLTEATDVNFGQFQPKTMLDLGMNDATFGTMRGNVTPLYRFVITTGNDDNLGNNRFEKRVRFYVERSTTSCIVSVENYAPTGTPLPGNAVQLGNRLNSDSLLAGLSQIQWSRTGTVGGNPIFNYDLFERDRWPQYALNFAPWQLVMWSQGEETTGLNSEERVALKAQQNAWNQYRPAGLFITGQEITRVHDVALNATNGNIADQEFVRDYLRAQSRGNTDPAAYENLRVQGLRITHGRFEVVQPTGVAGDAGPRPAVVRATAGEGVAQGSHWYVDHNSASTTGDSAAGMTIANPKRAVVFYAIDIRHFGRFAPEAKRSGVQRVVLGAIDFLNQYGTVLPVDVSAMEGHQTGREAVTITWETVSEKDIAGLELERAEVLKTEAGESEGSFHVIAERTPEGGPEHGASYRVLDNQVQSGTEYVYRLVSVEKDGSREPIRSVRVAVTANVNAAYSLEVRPNPVVERGVIAWHAPRGEEITLRIVDSRGRELRNERTVSTGEGEMVVEVDNLASGIYLIELQTSGGEVLREKMQIRK